MRIMADGEWGGYPTRIHLAELWGIEEVTVRRDSAEASRRLQMDPEQLEEFRQAQGFFFERIKREAVSRRSTVNGLPDWMAALKAAELALRCQKIDLEPTATKTTKIAMKVIVEEVPEGDDPSEPKKKTNDKGSGEEGGAPAHA